MRIALVAGTLGQGGAERQLHYIVRALVEAGATPRVFSLTRGEHYENAIRSAGVEVVWIGEPKGRLGRLLRLMRELRAWRPDIVQSQHFHANLYVTLASRWLGLPDIGALRSTGADEVRMTGRLGRACLRWPRFLAANSRVGLDFALAQGCDPGRVQLLGNVIDTEAFAPQSRPARVPLRVLGVGRLGPEKRFDRFLRALARVRERSLTPVEGWIVGDGPLRRTLAAEARRLGLVDHVEFRGAITDMTAVYASAEILVLPSDWEGTPNVLLEAMATGMPVLATRVGGVPGLVRDGENGLLVDVEDEESLACQLQRLVEEPELRRRLGTAGAEFVRSHHSTQGLAASLATLYRAART
jgi:glycosyltransferase involved in cell wall biosynthesis